MIESATRPRPASHRPSPGISSRSARCGLAGGRALRRDAGPGRLDGLAQAILQLTLPGVPDLYQGTELWDFSLVDPDNRRPVDYLARLAASGDAVPALADDVLGTAKQRATQRLLHLRREQPDLFSGYGPLDIPPGPAGWLGFSREAGRLHVVIPTRATMVAAPPSPPSGPWFDVLGAEEFDPARLSARWPFLVLVRRGA